MYIKLLLPFLFREKLKNAEKKGGLFNTSEITYSEKELLGCTRHQPQTGFPSALLRLLYLPSQNACSFLQTPLSQQVLVSGLRRFK